MGASENRCRQARCEQRDSGQEPQPSLQPDKITNQETLLVDYVERIAKNLAGRRAVHLHLSALNPYNRREHHIRIAANSFDGLASRHNGRLFVLSNNDIVMMCKGASVAEIDAVVLKLRFLFEDDPLTAGDEASGESGFCTWYDLEHGCDKILSTARRLMAEAEADRLTQAKARREAGAGAEEITEILTPERLARLEKQLKSMDLMPLIRRQPVCALTQTGPPTPVFNEFYISIDDLRRSVMPSVDLTSSRWLFQHLTEMLDYRVMRLLPELEVDLPLSTSININVSSLLSPTFLEFDRKLRALTRKTIVLEIQSIDALADMGAYTFARDFVRERGYRICLDGLDHLTLSMVDRQRFGFDFLKIQWASDIGDEVIVRCRAKLSESVRTAGPTRVILRRCDSPRALEFGRLIGITLFQGRHVDKVGKMPELWADERASA